MNNNYLEFLDCLKERSADNFLARTKDEINVKTNISQVTKDTSWIDFIEETIPYLDNIIRNPRKFIVQEEDIIPIEKTKKVTQESIKHLAQHTSLIQDVDEDGTVKPLKLLNVYKEETVDLYENRFINSLLINLKIFLNDQLQVDDGTLKSKYERIVAYKGETKLAKENIKINLTMESNFSADAEEISKNNTNNERIANIVSIVDDFLSTPFIKSLKGATPVRSPIRKTNVILKDQNFVKAVTLWEFLEKYNISETVKTVNTSKEEVVGNLHNNYALAYYLDYYAVNNINSKEKNINEQQYLIPYLRKVIETYVSECDTTDREFRNMVTKEFRNARKKQKAVYSDIRRDYKKILNDHDDRVKNALTFLK
jgi:hypothetical protein